MAPTPQRIARTSTELKKQYKKSGPLLTERQRRQLERGSELNQRATRAREADERRKAAKKKRAEREAKEARARKQIGVGLATQLIGYSHTQAQLKNGMEAFLGVNKRLEEEKRKKEMELTRKMEAIIENMEKEPWDDDDDDDDDYMAIDLAEPNKSSAEQFADEGLDNDSLLEAHDMLVSVPVQPVALPPLVPAAPVVLPPSVALNPPKSLGQKETEWDDFLDSSTQILRELASTPVPSLADTPKIIPVTALTIGDNCLPPISTQDLDFSMDDLDDKPLPKAASPVTFQKTQHAHKTATAHVSVKRVTTTVSAPPTAELALPETKTKVVPAPSPAKAPLVSNRNGSVTTIPKLPTRSRVTANSSRSLGSSRKIARNILNPGPFSTGLQGELAKLRPSQLPESMYGLYLKSKPEAKPSPNPPQPTKRQRRARCCQ